MVLTKRASEKFSGRVFSDQILLLTVPILALLILTAGQVVRRVIVTHGEPNITPIVTELPAINRLVFGHAYPLALRQQLC